MKKLLIFLLFLLLMVSVSGCAISQCPSSAIVFSTSEGRWISIPKGYLNPENENQYWVTEDALRKKYEEEYKK